MTDNTEKMRTVLTEMLKAQYNPPSVAGANADDIITRFEVEGLLKTGETRADGMTREEIKGYRAQDYRDGNTIKDENGDYWVIKGGQWTR